jgi:hypothetical protein
MLVVGNVNVATMEKSTTAIERAFQLAKSGRFASMRELEKVLKAEGYSSAQLEGPSLRDQLRELMRASREARR